MGVLIKLLAWIGFNLVVWGYGIYIAIWLIFS